MVYHTVHNSNLSELNTYLIPMVSITPGMIVRYCEREIPNRRTRPSQLSLNNLSLNHTQTDLSDKARKRIRKAVNWMVAITDDKWYNPPGQRYTMKVKIAFITVTLPSAQIHCDKVITKELLNQYLIELKKYHSVKNYVWKAEAQENGNLHYHIAIDQPVDYDKVRDRWNRIVNKLGYIDRFEKEHGHRNPNSTDVHKVKDVENIAAYISQYMAKKELRRPMCGKYWGCSQTISRCESIKMIEENEAHEEIEKIKRGRKTEVKQMDYCQLLFVQPENWLGHETPVLSRLYREYIQKAKNDELEAKRKKVVECIEAEKDSVIRETLVVEQVSRSMQQQVEQLNLFSSFIGTQSNTVISTHSRDGTNYFYSSPSQNLSTDNRTEKVELHSQRDG